MILCPTLPKYITLCGFLLVACSYAPQIHHIVWFCELPVPLCVRMPFSPFPSLSQLCYLPSLFILPLAVVHREKKKLKNVF